MLILPPAIPRMVCPTDNVFFANKPADGVKRAVAGNDVHGLVATGMTNKAGIMWLVAATTLHFKSMPSIAMITAVPAAHLPLCVMVMSAAPNGEALVPLANIIAGPDHCSRQNGVCFNKSGDKTLTAAPVSTTAILTSFLRRDSLCDPKGFHYLLVPTANLSWLSRPWMLPLKYDLPAIVGLASRLCLIPLTYDLQAIVGLAFFPAKLRASAWILLWGTPLLILGLSSTLKQRECQILEASVVQVSYFGTVSANVSSFGCSSILTCVVPVVLALSRRR
ncbi:hypothetical protein OUZ56_024282 [Daphnia magna]|uniref:Uncharacterized protein n=1 Tax=Daphnia magna TaxID=35525 RepID=A0ABR0B0I3_9CRUS|nr:hypothetical protein OUZ56_024282 [Daphnia magna]